jgi:signal transduction histidine kinase
MMLATLAATILCLIVGMLIRRTAIRGEFEELVAPHARYLYDRIERADCEAAPERWSAQLGNGERTYAYDAETLVSRNPAAPPLERELAADTAGRPLASESHGVGGFAGGTFVFRGADHGPCAILQTTWSRVSTRGVLARWVPIIILMGAAIGTAIGFVLLWPSVRRLAQHRATLQRHLGDVAHDLKTPISSLQLGIEHVLAENRDPALREPLAQALGDVVYLGALIANLRLAAELREGWKPQRGANDLAEVVERVMSRARLFAKHRDMEIESAVPDEPVMVECDPIAAEQALSNVVENAITHGERGEHVAVVLGRVGDTFALTVVDDGPGVAPAALPRLCERTFRADEARQRDPRGSGLGLAITSAVCDQHGWRLSFENEAPRGLRVTIGGEVAPTVLRSET